MSEQSGRDQVERAIRQAFQEHVEWSPRRLADLAIAATFRTPDASSEFGRAYLFVFTASLDTTNAALAELMSVVRRRLRRAEASVRGSFCYWELDAYIDAVAAAIEHLAAAVAPPSDDPASGDLAHQLMQNYETLFLDSVVFQPLKCSCTVLVPIASRFNLEAATRDANYVYCSGTHIFTKGVKKAKEQYVNEKLKTTLSPSSARMTCISFHTVTKTSQPRIGTPSNSATVLSTT